ncbi:hypothetical protein Fmac_020184 [Flemingia macrophylla]|uniref:Uncharacterized protein n=1 Tax=Flemingia macrophylla TaxID=520843 RepID=A0ABD1LTA5_9FABA
MLPLRDSGTSVATTTTPPLLLCDPAAATVRPWCHRCWTLAPPLLDPYAAAAEPRHLRRNHCNPAVAATRPDATAVQTRRRYCVTLVPPLLDPGIVAAA